MSVDVRPGTAFTFTPAEAAVLDRAVLPGRPVPSFDVSPDDKRFLILRETAPNDRNELIVVQNWVEEMNARARR